MSLEQSYEKLFQSLQEIVDADPQKVPQLLALILAGGPFRPFLDKPELLNKVVVMSKQYVAEKKKQATAAPTAPAATGTPAPARGPGRVMSVRDMAGPQGPSKA